MVSQITIAQNPRGVIKGRVFKSKNVPNIDSVNVKLMDQKDSVLFQDNVIGNYKFEVYPGLYRIECTDLNGNKSNVYDVKISVNAISFQDIYFTKENTMENLKLGAFSNSLSVKDLKASKAFYETLGFTVLGGSMESNYLIMKNENAIIGLFQGMFEGNIMTFNPGWDENGQNTKEFDDIRKIQKEITSKGIVVENKIDDSTTGPASIVITDPDGNMILIDQHR